MALPSQSKPSCAWDSNPPSSSATVCRQTFQTLTRLARAEATGNDRTVHALVPNHAVARRIIAFGRSIRRQGLIDIHVVPTPTLDYLRPGYVGAGFYLLGKTRRGRINAPQTVYLSVKSGVALVVRDQPGQEW